MLKIEIKEGEKIERALKRYKRKYRDTKMLRQIRNRKQYTKKSVARRQELIKAKYVQSLKDQEAV